MNKDINVMKFDDKEDKNVVPFEKPKLILSTGGSTTDENWLANLEEGTVFLAREKSLTIRNRQSPTGDYTLALELYMLQDKRESVAELVIKTPNGDQLSVWVSTLEFSRKKDLIEVLGKVTLKHDYNLEEIVKDD